MIQMFVRKVTAITSDTSLTVDTASARKVSNVKIIMLIYLMHQLPQHLDLTHQFMLKMNVEYCIVLFTH